MKFILNLLLFFLGGTLLLAQPDTLTEEVLTGIYRGSLSPPGKLVASDGTYEFYVKINWSRTQDAKRYHLYRSQKPGEIGKLVITKPVGQRATWKGDYFVKPGVLYYYQVVAEDATGNRSSRSIEDSGYIPLPRLIATPVPRSRAGEVSAEEPVLLAWTPCAGAESYEFQVADPQTPWSAGAGFEQSGLWLQRKVRSTETRLPWSYFPADSLAWSVKALSGDNSGYFSEPQVLVKESAGTLANPREEELLNALELSNGRYHSDSRTLSINLENTSRVSTDGLSLLLFASDTQEWNTESVLLQRSMVPLVAVGEAATVNIPLIESADLGTYRYVLVVPYWEGELSVEQKLPVDIR
jgi:hypothetical protein